MFHWKLSRKQKLLRNIVVTLAALGSLWWMLGFPALTTKSLLRRAEQAYLLDEHGEILYTCSWLDNGRTLSRHGDRLMSMNWERTLLGRRFLGAKLFDPEVRHILFYHAEIVKEAGKTYLYPRPELWGLVEDAASAELEWTVIAKDGAQMTWTMPGVRKDDHCLSFSFRRNYAPGTDGEESAIEERLLLGDYLREDYSALIRFYDAEGMLTETHWFDNVGYGYNISAGGEET
ncbi:MAG: hypothetical protein E7445_00015 [Ruminococcaceae bacterium]|nr:hypothetical protein [Oscillospiraceae bacterium]